MPQVEEPQVLDACCGEFLTQCVYALFELMYVHISVSYRGIYMGDIHSQAAYRII